MKLLFCAVSSGLLVLAREEQLGLGWRPHRWLAHRGVSVSSAVSGLACSSGLEAAGAEVRCVWTVSSIQVTHRAGPLLCGAAAAPSPAPRCVCRGRG